MGDRVLLPEPTAYGALRLGQSRLPPITLIRDLSMIRRLFSLGLVVALSTGCYHATVEIGATLTSQVVEKPWASGWIYGLVPPSIVETAQRCPSGVAKVETQLSLPNQLVSFVTFGIYTPMSIRVTCGQGRVRRWQPDDQVERQWPGSHPSGR